MDKVAWVFRVGFIVGLITVLMIMKGDPLVRIYLSSLLSFFIMSVIPWVLGFFQALGKDKSMIFRQKIGMVLGLIFFVLFPAIFFVHLLENKLFVKPVLFCKIVNWYLLIISVVIVFFDYLIFAPHYRRRGELLEFDVIVLISLLISNLIMGNFFKELENYYHFIGGSTSFQVILANLFFNPSHYLRGIYLSETG